MSSVGPIQRDFWAQRSLGDGASREGIPNKVALRTLSNFRQQVENWKQIDNVEGRDADPRDNFISYQTEYWANPTTTAWKTVNVELREGGRVEATHTRQGHDKPFEVFSAELQRNQLTSLSLIQGATQVVALASFIQVPGESVRDRKTF